MLCGGKSDTLNDHATRVTHPSAAAPHALLKPTRRRELREECLGVSGEGSSPTSRRIQALSVDKIELSWAAAEAPRACISWPQTDRQIDRDDREARHFTTQRIRRRYSRSLPSSSTRLDEIRFTSTLSVK
eukprot:scaffold42584_cov54-Phaeocystis_antarctica.AAC.1